MIRSSLMLLAVLAVTPGCLRLDGLEFAISPKQRDQAIAEGLTELADEHGRIRIVAREYPFTGSALVEVLASGSADLALIENSTPYAEGITTILPVFRALLHVLYRKDLDPDPDNPRQLFQGRTIFTPGPGSMPHELLLSVGEHLGVDWSGSRFVSEAASLPDIVVIFSAPSPSQLEEYRKDYRLFSLGDPLRAGRGSIADGIIFRYPQMQAVIIPENAYGELTPTAAVTLGVDMLLVARADLDDDVAYELTRVIIENKQQLAQKFPAAFRGIRESFDPSGLNFPLHPGSRDYLEREGPSFFERYVDLLAFGLSLIIALVSGLLALQRWRVHRRKNRIDSFYEDLLVLRESALDPEPARRMAALARVKDLEDEAFRQLIDERLAADESFRIFITLAHDVRRDLARGAESLPGTRLDRRRMDSGEYLAAAGLDHQRESIDGRRGHGSLGP